MTVTRVVKINSKAPESALIAQARRSIETGGLVVFPTETVYGIAVNLLNRAAVERLKILKDRPEAKQFSIHIADKSDIEKYAVKILPRAWKVMDRFWPGPLTVVLSAPEGKTVGLRMPRNAVAQELLRGLDVPVVAPSANLSGRPAPREASGLLADLDGKVDLVLDAGATELGTESTVLDARSLPFNILREGALKSAAVMTVANQKTVVFVCTGNSCRSVMAEYLLKKKMRDAGRTDVEVISAGTLALFGMGPTHETLRLVESLGMDASAHHALRVSPNMVRQADFVFVMERRHKEDVLSMSPEAKDRVHLLAEYVKMDPADIEISDPIGKPEEFYRMCFAKIREAVERLGVLL